MVGHTARGREPATRQIQFLLIHQRFLTPPHLNDTYRYIRTWGTTNSIAWYNKFADRNIPPEIERDGREYFLPPIRFSLYHHSSRWSLVSRRHAGTEVPPPCPRWVSRLRRRSRPDGVRHKTEVNFRYNSQKQANKVVGIHGIDANWLSLMVDLPLHGEDNGRAGTWLWTVSHPSICFSKFARFLITFPKYILYLN